MYNIYIYIYINIYIYSVAKNIDKEKYVYRDHGITFLSNSVCSALFFCCLL